MKTLTSLIAGLGLALGLCLGPPAGAQVTPTSVVALTNAVTTNAFNVICVASNCNTNLNMVMELPQGKPIAVLPHIGRTNAGITNVLFTFHLSADGTNWTTTTNWTYGLLGNGTAGVLGYYLVPPTAIAGVRYLRLTSVTNSDNVNSIYVSNVFRSY